jgi:hypothetical protein
MIVVVVVVSWYTANMQKRYKNVPTTSPCLPVCLSTYNLENQNRFSSKLTTVYFTKKSVHSQTSFTEGVVHGQVLYQYSFCSH